MKRCTKCGVEKEESQFAKQRSKRDGLQNWCKDCNRIYMYEGRHNPQHPAYESIHRGDERIKTPEHDYWWKDRQRHWRHRKVECVPGCSANDGFLCRTHYQALWDFQGGRCGLCGGLLARGMKPYPAADHWHRDPDGRGPVRGLLHGGKTGCNIRILGAFEAGRKVPDEALEIACRAYLDNPPSSRMVGSSWSRTPQPVPKYLGSEV